MNKYQIIIFYTAKDKAVLLHNEYHRLHFQGRRVSASRNKETAHFVMRNPDLSEQKYSGLPLWTAGCLMHPTDRQTSLSTVTWLRDARCLLAWTHAKCTDRRPLASGGATAVTWAPPARETEHTWKLSVPYFVTVILGCIMSVNINLRSK
jgi:hypothetical protein